MRTLLAVAAALGFCLVAGAPVAPAAAQTYAVTIADSLNVRDRPQGQIVGKLTARTVVVIRRTEGPWAEIAYLDGLGKLVSGWVATEHLRAVRSGPSTGGSYRTARRASFSLALSDTNLKCREGLMGGYDSCKVSVSFNVQTDYNGNDTPSVQVGCEAQISYTSVSGLRFSRTSDDTSMIYLNSAYGIGTMDIEFRLVSVEPIVRVRLTNAGCDIKYVY